ncbi:MAG TPA: VanW family protein [Candidatus Limnocylindrales bacterium]|nr:VanW family protein [Candidatus Limnocylindrales bacterium]
MTEPMIETPPVAPRRPRLALRFGVAFIAGILVALLLGTGAIYAYDRQYDGRVLPGVQVGGVDLGGMDRDEAIAALEAAYTSARQGVAVIEAGSVAEVTIPYEDFGRRLDAEAVADLALAAGRSGNPLERAVSQARTALNGATVEPIIVIDEAALAARVERSIQRLELQPVDGSIIFGEEGIEISPARWGRTFDHEAIIAEIAAAARSTDAPPEIRVAAMPTTTPPVIDDVDTTIARTTAERMIADVVLVDGDDTWSIEAPKVQAWLSFGMTEDGAIEPVVDQAKVEADLAPVAKDLERAPRNASYLVGKSGAIVGVTPSRTGRSLDATATTTAIVAALEARAAGLPEPALAPAVVTTQPALTTEEAEKVAPQMVRISTWRTYFPIGESNFYGANIWIPSSIIDGTVLAPGETFDFWRTVGEVSRARGYGSGGAIINGKTEVTGALAGGICSTSTTLFNAALRAGLKMVERGPHYYYIERYPLGLDATVWKSGGSQQSMAFTNDTKYPILIRGINTRDGNAGYVRFDLYSVPTERKVTFTTPIVKDVIKATTRTVTTTELKPGQRKTEEYPHDGKKVWVTRTVRDASGAIIHQETWYSHYKPVDGVILVGASSSGGSGGGSSPSPAPPSPAPPAPSPAPSTAPEPSPTPSG